MKIAVFSDIHGNLPALEAVIEEINNSDVDQIIVLGDLVTDFPQYTNDILDTIRSKTQNVIRGNREGYLIKANNELWKKHKQFSTILNTYQNLSKEDVLYLKALPRQISFTYDEKFSLRAVHGSPFSEFDTLYEEKTDLINHSLNDLSENILLCGHTHIPFVYSNNGKTLINVGSIGMNFGREQSAQYTIIQYEKDDIKIDMRKVKYNYADFKKSCDLDEPWTYLCLKSMEDGKDYNMIFLKEAERRFGVWPIPNDNYYALFQEWCEKGII